MERIRQLRKSKKISQVKMAYDLNLTQRAISAYEQGINEPSIDILKKIANYFETSVDYIIEYTDLKAPVDVIASTEMTAQEANVLHNFRKVKKDDRLKIEGYIEAIISESN